MRSHSVNIRVKGVPCEARFNMYNDGERDYVEDVALHNVKNGSELTFMYAKLDAQEERGRDGWADVFEDIWTEINKGEGCD